MLNFQHYYINKQDFNLDFPVTKTTIRTKRKKSFQKN